jgi:hypothetical protein
VPQFFPVSVEPPKIGKKTTMLRRFFFNVLASILFVLGLLFLYVHMLGKEEASATGVYLQSSMSSLWNQSVINDTLYLVGGSLAAEEIDCAKAPKSWYCRLVFWYECVMFAMFQNVIPIDFEVFKLKLRQPNFHARYALFFGRDRILDVFNAVAKTPEFKNLKIGYIHQADELNRHDVTFYKQLPSVNQFVLRNYYNKKLLSSNVLYIPNGFASLKEYNIIRDSNIRQCICENTIKPVSQRHYLFNFVGSIRRNRQVMVNILRESSYGPYLKASRDTKYYFRLLSRFAGGNKEAYVNILRESKFTLVPCGNNMETHRLWESLWFGSIPIIELCEKEPLPPLNNENLIYISNWKELPSLLSRYEQMSPEELDKLQQSLYQWFKQYLQTMQRNVINQMNYAWKGL